MLAALVMAMVATTAAPEGRPDAPITYLALGDSYTIGEGVPEAARWPVQLAAALRERGVTIEAPQIIARTGWSTDELARAMSEAPLRDRYGLVSLLIGVNDEYRGWPLARYEDEFARVLQRAITLAGGDDGHVIVLSIPDWGVTPFARTAGRDSAKVARELDDYNAAAARLCAAAHVAFVDITGISREADEGGGMLTDDGLHPSGLQYARWVAVAWPVAEGLVRKR